VLIKDLMVWIRNSAHSKVFDTDYEIRRSAVEGGARHWKERIKVQGWLQHAIMNDALYDELQRMKANGQPWANRLRECRVEPAKILETEM
jgi:hypothetical protein